MMMSHPLIPASLAPASVSMAMGQMNRLSTLASMANVAQLHANHHARAPTSVIKVIFVGSFDLEGAGGGCGGGGLTTHWAAVNSEEISVDFEKNHSIVLGIKLRLS